MGVFMRLRNVKDAKKIIEASDYVLLDYDKYRGCFNKLFNNNNEIHIEIGMGKGNFIMGMAIKYPDINFIGIEKFDSVLVRAVQKLEYEDIPNLKIIRMDALNIDSVFSNEISKIYLNFSDPWPKKRHANRRLTSPVFLEKYDKIFKDKKQIVQKTDNRELFEYSVMSFNNYGYIIDDISLDLHKRENLDNVETEYEKKFKELGNPIYMISLHK